MVKLAQNYNTVGGKTWAQGDFTGDGKVDFNDLVKLAQNYNTSLAGAAPVAAGGLGFQEAWAAALVPAVVGPAPVKVKPVAVVKPKPPVAAKAKPVIVARPKVVAVQKGKVAAAVVPAVGPVGVFGTRAIKRAKDVAELWG